MGKKLVIVFLSVIFLIAIAAYYQLMTETASGEDNFVGDELLCAIQLGENDNKRNGLVTGYNYELLKRFADSTGAAVRIELASGEESWLDSLLAGAADIVVLPLKDSLNTEEVLLSVSPDGIAGWAMRSDDASRFEEMNDWMAEYVGGAENDSERDIYLNRYEPFATAKSGVTLHFLSPYDEIIRKYSSELGWDWKLLVSVIFQESGFRIQAASHRGAEGLMQIMPETAMRYGAWPCLDPEDNIRTGVQHLVRLQKMFRKYARNQVELRKFTLAAYNAGEGHILDCINYAKSMGCEYDTWDALCELIPDFSEDWILEEESVHAGKFNGTQTVDYINKIYSLYWAFNNIYEPIPSVLSSQDPL